MQKHRIQIYKNATFPVVCTSVTLGVSLEEEHRLRIFYKRARRKYLDLRGWRKLRHEELHNLFSWLNISIMIKLRRTTWTGHVANMRK
jgi:hypothetical protein